MLLRLLSRRHIGFAVEPGYLLPVVIALGMAVSTVSIVALQLVAQNNTSLNMQYYNQLAREAAESGIKAAKYCMETTAILDGTTWNTPLTPEKNCSLANTYPSDYVVDNSTVSGDASVAFTTTYSVPRPTAAPSDTTGRTWVVASTGTVAIKGSGGSITVKTITKTTRAYMVSRTAGGGAGYRLASKLSTGPSTACAIANDPVKSRDWAYCWGDNSNYQLGSNFNFNSNLSSVPAAVTSSPTESQTTTTVNQCSVGRSVACAGANSSAINFDGKKVVDISVGTTHTCMVATDLSGGNGRAYCWGENSYGQLGTRNTTDSKIPRAVDLSNAVPAEVDTGQCGRWYQRACNPAQPASALIGKTVKSISAGDGFTCALDDANTVYCWGRSDHGQAGITGTINVPNRVVTSVQMKKLAKVYGGATICAIGMDDKGYCWGQSFVGQRGDGYRGTNRSDSDVSACRSGGGAVAHASQFPLDSRDSVTPTLVIGGLSFSNITIFGTGIPASNSIANGTFSSYVVAQTSDTGRMYWWGGSTTYQHREWKTGCHGRATDHVAHATSSRTFTGNGSPTGPLYSASTSPPTINNQALGYASGNAYNGYFCAQPATTSSPIYCDVHTGTASSGQLGNGQNYPCAFGVNCPPTTPQSIRMSSFGAIPSFSALETSNGGYTCAITNAQVYCWGAGTRGQIGNAARNNVTAPTAVSITNAASALYVDPSHSTTTTAPEIKAVF